MFRLKTLKNSCSRVTQVCSYDFEVCFVIARLIWTWVTNSEVKDWNGASSLILLIATVELWKMWVFSVFLVSWMLTRIRNYEGVHARLYTWCDFNTNAVIWCLVMKSWNKVVTQIKSTRMTAQLLAKRIKYYAPRGKVSIWLVASIKVNFIQK